MTKLLVLDHANRLCWALLGEYEEVFLLPFWDRWQALIASDLQESEWNTVEIETYIWADIEIGPRGYPFFVKENQFGSVIGVVVWGPYGLLSGIYPSINAASEAAWDNWWSNNPGLRPVAT
jgi:hypothetical protein